MGSFLSLPELNDRTRVIGMVAEGWGEGGGEFQNVLESVVERGLIGKRDSGGGMVGGVVGREDSEIGH